MSDISEQRSILADTVARLFRDAAGDQASCAEGWNDALWRQVEEIGLPLLLVPEAAGGIGGTWEDALVVLQPLGFHAIALPIAEAMLAMRLTALAGLDLPSGVVSLAPNAKGRLERDERSRSSRFSGKLLGVPWGAQADTVVAVVEQDAGHSVVLLPRAAASSIHETGNLAGEPRDALCFEHVEVAAAPCKHQEARRLTHFCALLRVGQIAGALAAVLARSIQYAKERTQFGRPIGDFQAVQQQLALLGSEAAAVSCAAQAAYRAAARSDAAFEIAAAKLRANLAIGTATGIAHQVHGAIGFTREHPLRHFTQRLWSWRSEFGNDRHWSGELGTAVAARGAEAFWPDLTGRGDKATAPVNA
jgi:acyl-CoA dehydrogenase